MGAVTAPAPDMVTPEAVGFLTAAEMKALSLSAELFNVIARDVIGHGRTRAGDTSELAGHVHNIQHMIMSQAAARAYPSEFRVLGGHIEVTS